MVSIINDAKCYKSPKARDYPSDWGEAGKASFVHLLIHTLLSVILLITCMTGIVPTAEHRKIRTPPSSDRVYNLLGFKEKITLTMDLKNQQYSDRCGLRKGGSKWKETEQRYVGHGCWGRGEVFSSFTQEYRVMQLEKRVEFCRLLSLIPSFYRRGSRAQRS